METLLVGIVSLLLAGSGGYIILNAVKSGIYNSAIYMSGTIVLVCGLALFVAAIGSIKPRK